jgi:hypothetical protein
MSARVVALFGLLALLTSCVTEPARTEQLSLRVTGFVKSTGIT